MNALFRLLITATVMLCSGGAPSKTLRADDFVTRGEFNVRLHKWISLAAVDQRSGLRTACENLSRSQNVAIILDRSLDPNREVKISLPVEGSIFEVLKKVSQSQNAELRVIGDAFLLLSPNSARKLKTLVAIRISDLKISTTTATRRADVQFQGKQIQKMLQDSSWQWDSLAKPRELVIEAAKKHRFKIEHPEMIPHDLWFQGKMPHANFIEFLSFVLVQYDLTFSWKNATTIQIRKSPARVVIEKSHRIPKVKHDEIQTTIQNEFPQSQWKQQGSKVTVIGPEELHERLRGMLQKKSPPKTNNRVPWNKRQFTMQVKRKPLGVVLEFLIASGIPIQVDKQNIKTLGIELEQLISFETKDADIETLINTICEPVNLPYQIGNDRIQIGGMKQ